MKPLFAITFIAILTVLAAATFIEQAYGSNFATRNIYHSWWFIALWTIFAAMSALIIVRKRLWQRLAVFTLHASFLFILIGAATTFLTSRSGVLHIREGNTGNMFLDDNMQMQPLPFGVQLDSFRIQYYPGTNAPADYLSYVTIITQDAHDAASASSCRQRTEGGIISMNNILCQDGFRLYQSSYDEDLKGTLLTVRYDPFGTPVTYTGYAIMALSMIWLLFSKKERFRHLLRQVMSAKALLPIAAFLISGTSLQARSLPTINSDKAKEMARQQVVYNDRIVPFSTVAHDFMLKIYGKTTYHGLSAEQVTYGWMARPEAWKNEAMIKVKDSELRRQLTASSDKYISLQSLFNEDGSYKLLTPHSTPHTPHSTPHTPHSTLHTPTKSLQDLDEKVGIIIMLTQGTLFTPLPQDATPLSDIRVEAEILYNHLPVIKILFMLNITLGILSLLLFAISGTDKKQNSSFFIQIILYSSFTALLLFYFLRWYISGHVPLGNGYETMLFMSLVIMLTSAIIGQRIPSMSGMGLLLSGFTLLVAHLSDSNPQITHLMPVLNSPLLSIHVSVIMMAYALLGMTFIIAVIYFIEQCLQKVLHSSFKRFSMLHPEDSSFSMLHASFTPLLLYPAVFLLAIGIFLGAVWANVSWGTYWSWDPKEVWALITMLIYAIPLHVRQLRTSGASLHAFMLLAFLTVLMTYFGVNFFLGGMHSYA